MTVKVREKSKGSGEWWIFINHHGKRRSKKVGDKKTSIATAKKIEVKLVLNEFNLAPKETKTAPTLKEYVFGWTDKEGGHPGWYKSTAELTLKNSTRLSWFQLLKTYILPEFGNKSLNELTPHLINNFIYKLFGKGLRSGSVKNIRNCLSAILRHAHNLDGYLDSNPLDVIKIPRPEDERPVREPTPFTWEDRDHFESSVMKNYPRYYPLIVCGLRTGLRIGELLALQWQNIDFHNRLIHVKLNVARGKVTTPKSKSSVREVRMTSQLVDALRMQRKMNMA